MMRKEKLAILLLTIVSLASNTFAQNNNGLTIGGIKGITKTVKEIIDFGKAQDAININQPPIFSEERELPEPLPSLGEENRKWSKWPNTAPTSSLESLGPTQTIHSNFMATDFNTHLGGWPPDNNGDVGTTQVFIAQNYRLRVYPKTGVTVAATTTPNGTSTALLASPVLDITQSNFFRTAFAGVNTTDPHVRFDRLSGRWFVVSMSTNEATDNYLLFAVSSGATIASTASFTFFRISISNFTGVNGDAGKFLDYPTLGVDAKALALGANIFTTSTGSFVQSSIYIVNKASMIAGTLSITAFSAAGLGAGSGADIRTPQGVHNDDPSAADTYVIGSSAFFSQLILRRFTYSGSTPSMLAQQTINVATNRSPLGQPAQGTVGGNLDASNTRLFASMMMKNKIDGTTSLWTGHTSATTSNGTTSTVSNDRNACRWYEIRNLSTTPTVQQFGTFFNDAATNQLGFWFPGIAMSGQGHAVLAASAAGATARCNIVIAGRYRTSIAGDLEDSVYATATGSDYNPFNGPTFVNRWGDYAQVVIDPQDNMTMWAFHQYTNTTNSYGVRAIQLKAPAPPASSVVTGAPATFCGSSVALTITGTSVNNTEFFDPGADVGGPGFNRLTITCSGGVPVTNVTFVSPTVVTCTVNTNTKPAGIYTLTITNPDGQSSTATFTLTGSCSIVPLKLLSFTGSLQKNNVELNWLTAQEVNIKNFEVEKSIDGINFAPWQSVVSKGINGANANYALTDAKPFPGTTYYRLKMINKDGTFTYSNTVLIKTNSKALAVTNMYPNPTKGIFNIELFSTSKKAVVITLFDVAGKVVMTEKISTANGLQQHQLDLSKFASGTYVAQVKTENGEVLAKTKFIKE
jgi:Secretion system C-terminal sorting domain